MMETLNVISVAMFAILLCWDLANAENEITEKREELKVRITELEKSR